MVEKLMRFKKFVADYRSALSIIGIYCLILATVSIIFYPLIPRILNYPLDTVGGAFQRELENANYTVQYVMTSLAIMTILSLYILYVMRGIENWRLYIGKEDKQSRDNLDEIARKCMVLPYRIYLMQTILPSVLLFIIHAISIKSLSITTFKIWISFFSFLALAAVITHIFSRKILTRILFNISLYENVTGNRIDLKRKIFIQMMPMFIVALLFTTLIGYSRLMKEKGDMLFSMYSYQIEMEMVKADRIDSDLELREMMKNIDLKDKGDRIFLISPEGSVTGVDGENVRGEILSPYFEKYLNEKSMENDGRVFEYYGFDVQGAVKWINVGEQEWIAGIKYIIASNNTLRSFIGSFVAMLALCSMVLYYFAKSLADDIFVVAKGLREIADGGVIDFEKKLVVTSNDEIGDLVEAFNKIQDKEKENIRLIKQKQEMFLEQERLASLGQLMGGIAHNLKTPIMSISGGIEALRYLVKEYDESIDDENVNKDDHHEIAAEMNSWLHRIKPHCSYMSDIITTVKGQAAQFSTSTTNGFTISELVKRVDILMKHELKRYNCRINLDSHVDMNTEIIGEVSSLVQIFDNIIVNAIHAYGEESGVIDFKIVGDEKDVIFSFQDYGSGIPFEIRPKLLKEMVTTKGKNGTGLGLYMAHSLVKGRFGGNIWFETELGKGTTFFVSIPCKSKNGRHWEVMQ